MTTQVSLRNHEVLSDQYISCSPIKWLRSIHYISFFMTKPTKWHVRPVKTQISLDIRLIWLESSLCVQWVATYNYPCFLHAGSEDSDQTGRMPIWSSLGAHAILLIIAFSVPVLALREVWESETPKHCPGTSKNQYQEVWDSQSIKIFSHL